MFPKLEENGIIATYITIDVKKALFDMVSPGEIMIRSEGGEMGDMGLWVSDQPVYKVGQNVIVFLKDNTDNGFFQTAGLYQGKYTIENGLIKEIGVPARYFIGVILGREAEPNWEVDACTIGELGWSWPSWPVKIYANSAGTSDCDGEFEALRRAGVTWNNVSDCPFTFGSNGLNSGSSPVRDSKNQIQWRNMGQGYIAATYIWYSGGNFVETDWVFEDQYLWSASSSCPSNRFDVENIAAHEFGHSVGCEDNYTSGCSTATMYGYGSYGETGKRTLTSWDEDCARRIY
jgi:hypothetical protein